MQIIYLNFGRPNKRESYHSSLRRRFFYLEFGHFWIQNLEHKIYHYNNRYKGCSIRFYRSIKSGQNNDIPFDLYSFHQLFEPPNYTWYNWLCIEMPTGRFHFIFFYYMLSKQNYEKVREIWIFDINRTSFCGIESILFNQIIKLPQF